MVKTCLRLFRNIKKKFFPQITWLQRGKCTFTTESSDGHPLTKGPSWACLTLEQANITFRIFLPETCNLNLIKLSELSPGLQKFRGLKNTSNWHQAIPECRTFYKQLAWALWKVTIMRGMGRGGKAATDWDQTDIIKYSTWSEERVAINNTLNTTWEIWIWSGYQKILSKYCYFS